MAVSDLRLAPDQPTDEVLLFWSHGGRIFLVSIPRAELDFWVSSRSPDEQNRTIEKNLENLEPVVRGKLERGEATQRTNRMTGRTDPLIEFSRADLEHGLRTSPVIRDSGAIGIETGSQQYRPVGQANTPLPLRANPQQPPEQQQPVLSPGTQSDPTQALVQEVPLFGEGSIIANPTVRLLPRLAGNVRRLRRQHGWSQEELATRARVSTQTISRIENRSVQWPQAVTMGGLARALGVRQSELYGFDDGHSILASLEQQRLGASWIEAEGRFAIDPQGTSSDTAAAQSQIVQQLHEAVVEKARRFSDASKRLDNALGWHGIAAASQRFFDGVQRPTEEIPTQLGTIYGAILELGSFLEQDLRLLQRGDYSADPLDPEVHRDLSDLIRTAAPWLRQFPTVRELDDQSASFLTQPELLDPGAAIINDARDNDLISAADAAAINGLIDAARRGEFQGAKARTRSVFSVRNLLYATVPVVASFFLGATASSYSEKSALIAHAGSFLASAEDHISAFVLDLPADLRIAFQKLITEIREHPDLFSPPS